MNLGNHHVLNILVLAGASYYGMQEVGKQLYFLFPIMAAVIMLVLTNGLRAGVVNNVRVSLLLNTALLIYLSYSFYIEYAKGYIVALTFYVLGLMLISIFSVGIRYMLFLRKPQV